MNSTVATPTRGNAGCSRPLLVLGDDDDDDEVEEVEAASIVSSRGRGDLHRCEELLLLLLAALLIDDDNRLACAIRSAALPRAAQEQSKDRMSFFPWARGERAVRVLVFFIFSLSLFFLSHCEGRRKNKTTRIKKAMRALSLLVALAAAAAMAVEAVRSKRTRGERGWGEKRGWEKGDARSLF